MSKTYIIAEAGVNHNGKEELAAKMIYSAKKIGADAIKFQLFNADLLTTAQAEQAEYQKKAASKKSQYEMLKELELSFDAFQRLHKIAQKEKIDFIITPFDLESLKFIVEVLNLPIIKIGSGDITNGPLLYACACSGKELIISTGMCTLAEVEQALKIVAFGFLKKGQMPTAESLDLVYSSIEAHALLQQKVTLLHCTSEYPAPIREANIKAIDTLSAAFGLKVGFSDHTVGIDIALAAVAREAYVIEKHFTLDKSMPGPDHLASIDVDEFERLVNGIRNIELSLGSGAKYPSNSERKNLNLVRRTLVANCDIKKGEVYTASNVAIKRPYFGHSPMQYWEWIGKLATKDLTKDEAIG